MQKRLSIEEYANGILNSDRIILGKAITLIESSLESDRNLANEVLEKILPHTGNSIRIGITGVPGVGKSTFIEVFGKKITQKNKKIAVLAIDPSSQRSGGSIMGDKTRMEELAHDNLAFIRPSPAGNSLGGVANKTRETILLCEAAGYEIIIIETVGVGQSETVVKEMVDFFLLLMLAGAGDELQGIKRGIMEMADAVVITKADKENFQNAQNARLEYQHALHLYPPHSSDWIPPVMTCSAMNNLGIDEIWEMIFDFVHKMKANQWWQTNRNNQNLTWFLDFIRQSLEERFYQNEVVRNNFSRLKVEVLNGKTLPMKAANDLLILSNR